VQFDQWEHAKAKGDRKADSTKCLQPNPNHCGRSPTVITLEYLPALELAKANKLFARKFDPDVDALVLDAIDALRSQGGGGRGPHFEGVRLEVAGGVRCVELGTEMGQPATLAPCTSGEKRQAFEVGPCSADGNLTLGERFGDGDERFPRLTRGRYAQPYCAIRRQRERGTGVDACMDVEGEAVVPGTRLISWWCGAAKWNQLFSFGDSQDDGKKRGHRGALFINVPFVAARDKRLCLEAVPPRDDGDASGGTALEDLAGLTLAKNALLAKQKRDKAGKSEWGLVAMKCDPDRPLQRFAVHPHEQM